MTSPLQDLVGLAVTEVVEIHDYVQFHLGSEIGISIYNQLEVSPRNVKVLQLVGKTVAAVSEREDAIEIRFVDGSRVAVDMRHQAYRGPEALELMRRGEPPVIWN